MMKMNSERDFFNNFFAKKPEPSRKAVPIDKVLEIFDQLADRKDIAFGYTASGCSARAHIMCHALMDMGFEPKKAWAFEGDDCLFMHKPNGGIQRWGWHVAPVLTVELPGGNVQDMVIDP